MRRLGFVIPIVVYIFLLNFPAYIATIASITGNYFSYVGIHWQLQNQATVITCLIVSSLTIFVVALATLGKAKTWNHLEKLPEIQIPKAILYIVYLILLLLCGYGLYYSFPRIELTSGYYGAQRNWLSIGSWSVIYSFLIFVLAAKLISKNNLFLCFLSIFVLLLPSLTAGSRIDFLSVNLAAVMYMWTFSSRSWKLKILASICVIVFSATVALFLGTQRGAWTGFSVSSPLGNKMTGFSVSSPLGNKMSEIAVSPPLPQGEKTFYLSTFGDIGASVFQSIGLVDAGLYQSKGLDEWLRLTFYRLAPQFLSLDRPGELGSRLSEPLGGGASHFIAEGYLVQGLFSVVVLSGIFGFTIGLTTSLTGFSQKNLWFAGPLLYSIPWILLIRGGWYQFFSLFRGISIVLTLLLILYGANYFVRLLNNSSARSN